MSAEHIWWLGASFLAGTTLGGGLGYLAWQQEKRLREFWRTEAVQIAQREKTERDTARKYDLPSFRRQALEAVRGERRGSSNDW